MSCFSLFHISMVYILGKADITPCSPGVCRCGGGGVWWRYLAHMVWPRPQGSRTGPYQVWINNRSPTYQYRPTNHEDTEYCDPPSPRDEWKVWNQQGKPSVSYDIVWLDLVGSDDSDAHHGIKPLVISWPVWRQYSDIVGDVSYSGQFFWWCYVDLNDSQPLCILVINQNCEVTLQLLCFSVPVLATAVQEQLETGVKSTSEVPEGGKQVSQVEDAREWQDYWKTQMRKKTDTITLHLK